MKAIFCGLCGSLHSLPTKGWVACDCGNMAGEWVDPVVGTAHVLANNPGRAYILGLNNTFIHATVLRRLADDQSFRELHEKATDAPGYLFDRKRRDCWACLVRVGLTDDVTWHPLQPQCDGEKLAREIVAALGPGRSGA